MTRPYIGYKESEANAFLSLCRLIHVLKNGKLANNFRAKEKLFI
jgi:hypothetical protein